MPVLAARVASRTWHSPGDGVLQRGVTHTRSPGAAAASTASLAAPSRASVATPGRALQRRDERGEVLPLAVAAEDHHSRAGATRRPASRGATVRRRWCPASSQASTSSRGHELQQVGLAAVLAQPVQHRRQGEPWRGQRQRGQRVAAL